MPIVYIKGDVTKASQDIIAHGVNCKGAMGSGVALALLKRWSRVREQYMVKHQNGGWRLGDIQYVPIGEGRFVANCATQKDYLPRGPQHADYDAIEKVMNDLAEYCAIHGKTLAMPKIGAGLAGGDWKVIRKIIDKAFPYKDVFVYHLD